MIITPKKEKKLMSFIIKCNGKEQKFSTRVRISELLDKNDEEIICARVNNRLKELSYYIDEDAVVEFLTIKDEDAAKIYEASLRYVAIMAFHRLYPELRVRITRNVSRSTFIQILNPGKGANQKMKNAIEEEMKKIIAGDFPLIRHSIPKEDAKAYYERFGLEDKLEALQYRPESKVHLYECDGYYNYLSSRMVPSTGYLKNFKLHLYVPGLILQSPRAEAKGDIPPFVDVRLFAVALSAYAITSVEHPCCLCFNAIDLCPIAPLA